VPQSQHKPLQPTPKLPNPELNPLLNPTLGNNLGRWAQVYFTSPPEKREEAVLELLHELEAEAGSNGTSQPLPDNTPPWLHAMESDEFNPALTCAECGHQNAPQQRFCGMCGSRLVFSDPPIESSTQSGSESVRQTREISPSPVPNPDPVPSFGSLSLFATAPTNKDTEVQWLQEKSYDSDDSQRSSATKYLVTALGLMLLGVLFYAQWKPQKSHPVAANSTGASHPAAVNQPPESRAPEPAATQPATEPAASEAAPPNEAAPKASNPLTQAPARETAKDEQNPSTNKTPPAVQNTEPAPVRNASTVQPEAASASAAAGAEELAQAEGYLTGKYGSRNSSEAARYLWTAVSKENPTAILLLSDLYLAGDGVPKSCAQAQLLLRAAARKNVAAAANKLRELQQTGCP
jgi:hypothetical protein